MKKDEANLRNRLPVLESSCFVVSCFIHILKCALRGRGFRTDSHCTVGKSDSKRILIRVDYLHLSGALPKIFLQEFSRDIFKNCSKDSFRNSTGDSLRNFSSYFSTNSSGDSFTNVLRNFFGDSFRSSFVVHLRIPSGVLPRHSSGISRKLRSISDFSKCSFQGFSMDFFGDLSWNSPGYFLWASTRDSFRDFSRV